MGNSAYNISYSNFSALNFHDAYIQTFVTNYFNLVYGKLELKSDAIFQTVLDKVDSPQYT